MMGEGLETVAHHLTKPKGTGIEAAFVLHLRSHCELLSPPSLLPGKKMLMTIFC